jgi:LmbE family N-acetylglucosaminyl deacetylase
MEEIMGKTLLLLTAHADDAEFFAGGTILRAVAEGWTVHEVIATDNGKGSFELPTADLVAASRDREEAAVAKFVGKASVAFLGYPDGDMAAVPPLVLRGQFMRAIRRLRPDRVMTFDPYAPFEPHPDHRAVAWAAVEAVSFSHMPLFYPEHADEGLKPHLVPDRWYFAKSDERFNHFVDVSAHLEGKIQSLLLHESQMKMTVDDIRMSLLATGTHPELLPLLDRDNPEPLLRALIPVWAARTGEAAGLAAAEGFRRESAGDLFAS